MEENIAFLNIGRQDIVNNRIQEKKIQDLQKAIKNMGGFEFLKEDVEQINEFLAKYERNERGLLQDKDFSTLLTVVSIAKLEVAAVIKVIEEMLPEQLEHSISIKLPQDYKQLSEISNFLEELDRILKQTLVGKYKTNIKFQNFDIGANWIEVIIENKDALPFLGSLIRYASHFLQKGYLQWNQTKLNIHLLNVDDSTKEMVIKAVDEQITSQAQLNASALMKDFNLNEGNQEYYRNVSHSILKLAELMTNGSEFQVAFNAPQETKEVFPNPDETKQYVEESGKYLTNGLVEYKKSQDVIRA